MKFFLDIYADIIYKIYTDENFEESLDIKNAMERVSEELDDTDKIYVHTLQLYCLKVLMNKYSMTIELFKQHIMDAKIS
jgi:hypothetical protein